MAAACQKPQTAPASSEAKRYPLKGKVVSVDKEKKKAKIEHEAIPGFMEAMTMDFPIKEDWVWENLAPGAEVRAELVVDNAADESILARKHRYRCITNPRPARCSRKRKFRPDRQTRA